MSDNTLTSDIEQAQKPVVNNQIQGETRAANPNFNPFPSISIALKSPNPVTKFECDAKNKTLYTVESDTWQPTHATTLKMYEDAGKLKQYKPRPEETAEEKKLDNARFPDHTFKYMISYTMFKRMLASDGEEYLVRHGYLHGISLMNVQWLYFKQNFDYHWEPVFEPNVGSQSNYFQVTYGEEINQMKKFHTKWDKELFDKSLRDIPFPGRTNVGVKFKIGTEGSLSVVDIPSLTAFRNKSFEELHEYASTGNKAYLEVQVPQKKK